MRFHYQAIDTQGRRQRGELEVRERQELEVRLAAMGLEMLRARRIPSWPWRSTRALPRRTLIQLCFQLEQLLQAGVPLMTALEDLAQSSAGEDSRGLVRGRIQAVIEAIHAGASFSQALSGHPPLFPPLLVHLVAVGEQSGQLPEILHDAVETLKWEDEVQAQRQKILLYPMFVGGVVLLVTLFLLLFLVPQLQGFIKQMGQALPWYTQFLFDLADGLRGPAAWWLLLPLGLGIGMRPLVFRHPRGPQAWDAALLRVPVFGAVLKKMALARLVTLLALLYKAGVPILQGLATTLPGSGNRQIEAALRQVMGQIEAGAGLSAAFAQSQLFPPLVLRMLHLGESTGRLDHALGNVAYFYHRDIRETVARLQTLIEPTLTLCLGALLGWIMLAVIGPIYDVISRIRL